MYPIPEPGGLGVHLTLDLAGRARFGPDVQWVEESNYDVEPAARRAVLCRHSRRTGLRLPDGALQPAYAGIRPKISGPTEAGRGLPHGRSPVHGVPGIVNLFGIESPGLTGVPRPRGLRSHSTRVRPASASGAALGDNWRSGKLSTI